MPILQFPNYLPNYPLTFYRKVEPIDKIKTITNYDSNKFEYIGTGVDLYV